MAISDGVQTLGAAFSFGILFQAATAAILLYTKGHGSTIFKDRRRLVLVIFLISSALWAQVDFANFLIPATSSNICQGTVIASTLFDQVARVSIGGFLLWSVAHTTKSSAERYLLGALLGLRAVAGGIFTGFARPQFAPVCVAQSDFLPASITVLGIDAIAIGIVVIRIFTLGLHQDVRNVRSSTGQVQSKSLIFVTAGFTIWTLTSVLMLLGFTSTILMLRTAIPSVGLMIVVSIVALYHGALVIPRAEDSNTPEARSPFVAPPSSQSGITYGEYSGSPVTDSFAKNVGLFVVNPSDTPNNSSASLLQQNASKEDEGGYRKYNITTRNIEIDESGPLERRELRRGSSGVFGSIAAAPLANRAPTMPMFPTATYPITTRVDVIDRRELKTVQTFPGIAQQNAKKSIFGRSKQPEKPSVRKLGISGPVLNEEDETSTQPFSRMQTVDLATAVANERARRDMATKRELIAQRQAPRPPTNISASEALQKSTSTKRKQMPGGLDSQVFAMPSKLESDSGLSVKANNGSTTSASLSPGREEVRRRSPRMSKEFGNEKPAFSQMGPRPKLAGLPSNPRQTIRAAEMNEYKMPQQQQQTVMYMNDIVYNDPLMVSSIINGAPKSAPKDFTKHDRTPASALPTSGSVIHRPRPYRRESIRSLFPGEPSPNHKRSKSGSSINTPRKSMFLADPGSPTTLPPLPRPPPPTTVSRLGRILPNDTRSMTVDEKIQLLFPLPPGAKPYQSRRSSVPSIPRIPSAVFQFDLNNSGTAEESQSRRASKRTTIASFNNLPLQIETPKEAGRAGQQSRDTYRYSANTYMGLAEIPVTPWAPELAEIAASRSKPTATYARSLAEESDKSDFTVATTAWASLHSPTPPVDIAMSQQLARETYIQLPREQNLKDTKRELPQMPYIPLDNKTSLLSRSGTDTRARDLSPASKRSTGISTNSSHGTRNSILLDDIQFLPEISYTPPKPPQPKDKWHTRIGDRLPMFSERRLQSRSKTMPPPTPLLLGSRGRQATVVVREPEPVQDHMNSPERAIKEIQEQLRKFEEPTRGSVGSLLRRMPSDASNGESEVDRRLGLLENLEKEMGQQENQWQQMQHNFDRDSTLTLSPQIDESEPSLSRRPSVTASVTSISVARRAQIKSGMTGHSKGQLSTSTMSTQSSDNSRASVWQARLAEAQMSYLENAPALLGKQTVNFLSLSKAQIGSPTPPDSLDSTSDIRTDIDSDEDDEESGFELDSSMEAFPMPGVQAVLWQPSSTSNVFPTKRMWSPPHEKSIIRSQSPEPAARHVRPAQRFSKHPLKVESTSLWKAPAVSNPRPPKGLWGSRMVRPKSIITRPKTQKPQRKSRRVTFLPDIVESPSPLPHKRETLGIFQFPWGEKSDSAVYNALPPRVPRYDPGASLNPGLAARSLELEPEVTEYSSSFFDDYDEEIEEEDSDSEIENSDDEFDDTTLWEIGNLLNSTDVPSRDSMLPPPRIIEDYDDEDSEEEFEQTQPPVRAPIVRFMPIQPLMPRSPLAAAPQPEPVSAPAAKPLWMAGTQAERAIIRAGLAQPAANVWKAYIPASTDTVRAKPREVSAIPAFESEDLWSKSQEKTDKPATSYLWGITKSASPVETQLWSVDQFAEKSAVQSWLTKDVNVVEPIKQIAGRTASKPRPGSAVPPAIKSRDLWSKAISSALVDSVEKKSTSMWNDRSVAVVSSTKSTKQSAPQLWTARQTVMVIEAVGLFTANLYRTDYRSSSEAPAAVDNLRKPRISNAGLPNLQTQDLWTSNPDLFFERHWISESSIRPKSPSIYSDNNSPTSSGRSSPNSDDGESIASASTKASSIWSQMSSIAGPSNVPIWLDSKRGAAAPGDESEKFTSKLPVRQKSVKRALEPVRESRVLASRDMWEKMAPVADKVPKKSFRLSKSNTASSTPVSIEARRERPQATVFEWAAALAEAVSQGSTKLQRPKSNASDWMNALKEAMQFESLPETLSVPAFDASVRHPVFFAQSMSTDAAIVHPAAMGYVSIVTKPNQTRTRQRASTWTSPKASIPATGAVSSSAAMWTPQATDSVTQATLFSAHPAAVPTTKKVIPVTSALPLPSLESATFWSPKSEVSNANTHWLQASSQPAAPAVKPVAQAARNRAATWTPPSMNPVSGTSIVDMAGSALWIPSSSPAAAALAADLASIFGDVHMAPWERKSRKADEEPMQKVESSMWRYSTMTPVTKNNDAERGTGRNWMVERRASKVDFRY